MGSAGRIVIPKQVRDAAGLEAGAPVEVRLEDGVVTIERAEQPMGLERRGPFLVIVRAGEEPVLTVDDVNRVVREIRDERFREITGGLEPSD